MDGFGRMKRFSGKIDWSIVKHIKSFIVAPSRRKLICIGKPWFFQVWQKEHDRQHGVVWDTDIILAPEELKSLPPRIRPIFGPSRRMAERRLPWDHGTNWGPGDPRNGIAWKDLPNEERFEPPPPYTP